MTGMIFMFLGSSHLTSAPEDARVAFSITT